MRDPASVPRAGPTWGRRPVGPLLAICNLDVSRLPRRLQPRPFPIGQYAPEPCSVTARHSPPRQVAREATSSHLLFIFPASHASHQQANPDVRDPQPTIVDGHGLHGDVGELQIGGRQIGQWARAVAPRVLTIGRRGPIPYRAGGPRRRASTGIPGPRPSLAPHPHVPLSRGRRSRLRRGAPRRTAAYSPQQPGAPMGCRRVNLPISRRPGAPAPRRSRLLLSGCAFASFFAQSGGSCREALSPTVGKMYVRSSRSTPHGVLHIKGKIAQLECRSTRVA